MSVPEAWSVVESPTVHGPEFVVLVPCVGQPGLRSFGRFARRDDAELVASILPGAVGPAFWRGGCHDERETAVLFGPVPPSSGGDGG